MNQTRKLLLKLGIFWWVTAVVLTACTGEPADAPTTVGVPGVTLSDETGAQLGQIAPDFTVPTLDGRSYTLTDNNGKPAIIFFMAYWCGSCVPEARALAQLQQEYGDAVNIIAIDLDTSSTPELLRPFKEAADDGDFTWGFDSDNQVALTYEVQALDTTLVLDSNGHVVFRDAFPTTYDQLNTVLEQLGL